MSLPSVTVRLPAKVNLEPLVGTPLPREDGYHPLSTFFHAVTSSTR
jgi:4-diphosphocytidyl-2-C-methyl-D-erythritol kinase